MYERRSQTIVIGVRRVALTAAAIALCFQATQADTGSTAESILAKAQSAVASITPKTARAPALLSIANAYAKSGNHAAALSALDAAAAKLPALSVEAPGKPPPALTRRFAELAKDAATARASSGDKDGAGIVLSNALKHTERLGDSGARAEAMTTLANAYTEIGDTAAAASVLAKADTAAKSITDEWKKRRISNLVAEAAARTGDLTMAAAAARTGTREGYYPWAGATVATAQANAGQRESAIDNLNHLRLATRNLNPLFRAQELTKIADASFAIGDRPSALSTLDAAFLAAMGVPNPYYRASVLSRIAEVQVMAIGPVAAQATARAAAVAARGIQKPLDRSIRMATAAKALAIAGDMTESRRLFNEAISLARTGQDTNRRSIALAQIAEAQAKAGDVPAALATLDSDEIAALPRVGALVTAAVAVTQTNAAAEPRTK